MAQMSHASAFVGLDFFRVAPLLRERHSFSPIPKDPVHAQNNLGLCLGGSRASLALWFDEPRGACPAL